MNICRIINIDINSSLKNPAKYIGKKPRKYTVPVPIKQPETATPGARAPGSTRASARSRGVDPIAAQAAAAAQVRTYRDNGVKHSSSAYNRVCRLIRLSFQSRTI